MWGCLGLHWAHKHLSRPESEVHLAEKSQDIQTSNHEPESDIFRAETALRLSQGFWNLWFSSHPKRIPPAKQLLSMALPPPVTPRRQQAWSYRKPTAVSTAAVLPGDGLQDAGGPQQTKKAQHLPTEDLIFPSSLLWQQNIVDLAPGVSLCKGDLCQDVSFMQTDIKLSLCTPWLVPEAQKRFLSNLTFRWWQHMRGRNTEILGFLFHIINYPILIHFD